MIFLSTINSDVQISNNVDKIYASTVDSIEFKDTLKQRWKHSVQMYKDYGLPILSHATVIALHNTDIIIGEYINEIDTSLDRFYHISNDNENNYICNWRIFSTINNYWRTIEHGSHFIDIFKHDYNQSDCYREWLYANNIKSVEINV